MQNYSLYWTSVQTNSDREKFCNILYQLQIQLCIFLILLLPYHNILAMVFVVHHVYHFYKESHISKYKDYLTYYMVILFLFFALFVNGQCIQSMYVAIWGIFTSKVLYQVSAYKTQYRTVRHTLTCQHTTTGIYYIIQLKSIDVKSLVTENSQRFTVIIVCLSKAKCHDKHNSRIRQWVSQRYPTSHLKGPPPQKK